MTPVDRTDAGPLASEQGAPPTRRLGGGWRLVVVAVTALVAAAAVGIVAWRITAATTSCSDRIGGASDAELDVLPVELDVVPGDRLGELTDDVETQEDLGRLVAQASSSLPADLRWIAATDVLIDVETAGDMVVVMTSQHVVALDAGTGAERWRASLNAEVRGLSVLGDRVVAHGRVRSDTDDPWEERHVVATWDVAGDQQDCTEVSVRRAEDPAATVAFGPDGVGFLDPSGRRLSWYDSRLQERWSVEVPGELSGIRYGGGRIVARSAEARRSREAAVLAAFDTATGQQEWTAVQDTVDDLRPDDTPTELTSVVRPLTVTGDHVITAVLDRGELGSSGRETLLEHHVAAFGSATGERLWATPFDRAFTRGWVQDDTAIVLGTGGGAGFDLGEGTPLWQDQVVADGARPVEVGDELLAGAVDVISLLDPTSGRTSPVARIGDFVPLAFAADAGTLGIALERPDGSDVVLTYEVR